MAVFAAIENEVIRLTREGKEIERVLAVEWDGLNSIDPVELSSTILRFYDAGIKATHAVLRDESDLHSRCEGPRGYELNDAELSNCRDQIGNTQSWMEEDCFYLRAITLCGWMHVRSNLGIEYLTIRRNGTVQQRQRKVLSKQIFSRFPQIRY